ncbi:hypothetical protein ASE14_10535 [Agromyces sp. Root81]|uniref:hypothetical protein n=1 Tax=Agromyces sp. Root81 TaxID=1736601 RepID=UPI000700B801|nr:hypothetical protein [Agromyces sp. Root81]KRC61324.1 hypothetical protein ASE14_10535 [Agromyces sp. Root81]
MHVEILHIDDCPNTAKAGAAARAALDAAGLAEVAVEFVLLTTPEAARETPFAGSPTIAVDGRDLFPSDGATDSLACRVYPTPTGLAGAPTVEQIAEALTALADDS